MGWLSHDMRRYNSCMARETHDREDLLRDATAFVSRVQLKLPSSRSPVEVFVGFRSDGAASFYFDQDPVYHFNRSGELRRAFVDELLIKADSGQLVTMRREREGGEVAMVTRALTGEQQAQFCRHALQQLGELREALELGRATVEGSITDETDEDVVDRVMKYLDELREISIAALPRVSS